MTLAISESEIDGVSVYYSALMSDWGFYRSTPDSAAYVCLNQALLDGSNGQHQTILLTLISYHHSLSTWDRLVPILKYFREMVPPEALPMPEPEIIILGRSMRIWRFQAREETHVVGRAG